MIEGQKRKVVDRNSTYPKFWIYGEDSTGCLYEVFHNERELLEIMKTRNILSEYVFEPLTEGLGSEDFTMTVYDEKNYVFKYTSSDVITWGSEIIKFSDRFNFQGERL